MQYLFILFFHIFSPVSLKTKIFFSKKKKFNKNRNEQLIFCSTQEFDSNVPIVDSYLKYCVENLDFSNEFFFLRKEE